MAQRFELRSAGIAGADVYAVVDNMRRGSVLGWLQALPSGWRRYGYETGSAPLLRTPQEAIDELIEFHSFEEDTSDEPRMVR